MASLKAERAKRQENNEYSDFEDDDEDHLNGGSGQDFDPADFLPNEHGARLCKSFTSKGDYYIFRFLSFCF